MTEPSSLGGWGWSLNQRWRANLFITVLALCSELRALHLGQSLPVTQERGACRLFGYPALPGSSRLPGPAACQPKLAIGESQIPRSRVTEVARARFRILCTFWHWLPKEENELPREEARVSWPGKTDSNSASTIRVSPGNKNFNRGKRDGLFCCLRLLATPWTARRT